MIGDMKFLIFILTLSLSIPLFAQKVELSDDPQTVEVSNTPTYGEPAKDLPTGKAAAQKFFTHKNKSSESTFGGNSEDHYLMFGIGSFINSKSYKWGPDRSLADPGEFNAGVTYRFGEWVNSMDFMVRLEYQTFDVNSSTDPKKMSIVPMFIFPDARSGFPIYFGAGAGVGIFFSQPDDESNISFDYQIVLGGRMLNVFDTVGFFAETGVKNHVLLLSSGQLNGVFVTIGSVFTF
jgi:hypothetical protein